MYSLNTPISQVKGIGALSTDKLNKQDIFQVKDFLINLPLKYSDRSKVVTINNIPLNELVTFIATIQKISSFYRYGKRFTTITVQDRTGTAKLMWFNSSYIHQSLKVGDEYSISGKLNNRKTIVHPVIEKVSDHNLHTARLVPIYSNTLDIKQGKLRRLLDHIFENLVITENLQELTKLMSLKQALLTLHFPDKTSKVVIARERLALEELLVLIKKAEQLKKKWSSVTTSKQVKLQQPFIPQTIPFTLTNSQEQATQEILTDLTKTTPMNRVLIGDVGSGKTVVAGIATQQVLKNNYSVAFIAPTKILAQQHLKTLTKLFPDIKIELVTSKTKKITKDNQAKLFLGTHAVINRLEQINPQLIIYDEQHKFGVEQRSKRKIDHQQPHTLTMSATPIPRSLMLTIFSHLSVSYLTQMPKNRKETKTWLVTEEKRSGSYQWLTKQLTDNPQKIAFVVCPFINPSSHEAFNKVASATTTYDTMKKWFKDKKIKLGLLHGQMNKTEQDQVIKQLYNNQIDILVTTPIIEVGIDLPTASIIIIESAQRFGMASLHQLRGRVGRAGQQGYCLLFSNTSSSLAKKRLKQFTQVTNGLKLAELDLKNRGSGDLFGTTQSGFSQLKFANWTNLELITQAKSIYSKLPNHWQSKLLSNKQVVTKIILAN